MAAVEQGQNSLGGQQTTLGPERNTLAVGMIMHSIVNNSGTIYEKDPGPKTTNPAEAMTAYDLDSMWPRAE